MKSIDNINKIDYNINIKIDKIKNKIYKEVLKMIIKNKFKFIRSVTIIVFLLITLFSTSIAKTNIEEETISYIVCKGDTLWTIAKEYKADDKDIRQYIYEIKKIYNMTNSNIYEGQILRIVKE